VTGYKRLGRLKMPRSRVEIQEKVNSYRASIMDRQLLINDPVWDDKYDPRYLEAMQLQKKEVSELMELERELADAKARGEKGRSQEEIREHISKNINMRNQYLQCLAYVHQMELNEAIEEERAEKKYG
jgi:hypothetical protein